MQLKLERKDGSVLDCMSRPLPDGATMLTFQDITDTENVERALRESNDALKAADQMKIDFVHHVSYELRAPLTTIIGFAHFLCDPSTGPLTPKQAEYLDYVTKSTNALLALTNNILDLATIDAGAMKLELGPVDIRKAIEAAAEGLQDRLATDRIRLKVDVDANIGSFIGDERRVVQVLYNLLANAVGFSPQDATVAVSAQTDRTQRGLHRDRCRPGHAAGCPGQGVRHVREPFAGLAASRRRARLVAGALLCQTAWRRRAVSRRPRAREPP